MAILVLCFLCQPLAGLDPTPTVLRKDSAEQGGLGVPGGPPIFLSSEDPTVASVFLSPPPPFPSCSGGTGGAGEVETEVALRRKPLPALGVISWASLLCSD